MNFTKKNLLKSFGLTLNEIKKSFLISYFFVLILFGALYLSYAILITTYSTITNITNAKNFIVLTILLSVILLTINYNVLNRIRKITELKIINIKLGEINKNKTQLEIINTTLDKNFTKNWFRNFLVYLFATIIIILIIILLTGIYYCSYNLALKVLFVVIAIIILSYAHFALNISLVSNNLKEFISNNKYYCTNFKTIFCLTIIILIINITSMIALLIPIITYYLFAVIFAFTLTFSIYYGSFVINQIYLKEKLEKQD